MFTTRTLAEQAGVTPRRILQLIEGGEIAAVKLGRDYVIEAAEATRWLATRGKEVTGEQDLESE